MPVTIMTGQSFPSTVYYVALATALSVLSTQRLAEVSATQKRYQWLFVCMAGPCLIALLSALLHGRLSGADLETGLRFLLGVWVFVLALSYMPITMLWRSTWGFVIAAVAASSYILYLSWPNYSRPNTGAVYNAVGYGNHTIMLVALVLLSTQWTMTRWPLAERILKFLVAAITLAAFVLTQTRSGWVAVPIFTLIAGILLASKKRSSRIIVTSVALLAVMTAIFVSNDTLRARAVEGYEQTISCRAEHSTANTSICIRLQLWRASLNMMSENPIAGIGDKRLFGEYLKNDSLPKGIVSQQVAKGWGEPHNDLMLALATFGIPGGLALLLVYLAPAWMFARRLAFHHPIAVRTAAAMGLAFCLGFFIFGLTETMLRGMRTVSYYAMCVALFLTLSDPVKAQRERGASQ